VITKTLESMPANGAEWHTADGGENGAFANCHRPDLASVRFAAASGGELQVLPKPVIRRETPRRRGLVHESAGSCDSAIVLCVDAKSQVRALNRTQPCF